MKLLRTLIAAFALMLMFGTPHMAAQISPPTLPQAAGLDDETVQATWCGTVFFEESDWYEYTDGSVAWHEFYYELGVQTWGIGRRQIDSIGWTQERRSEFFSANREAARNLSDDPNDRPFLAQRNACETAYGGAERPAEGGQRQSIFAMAEAGDSQAQAYLAEMYYFGDGGTQDHAQAAHWFRLAAEQGHRFSQFNLGIMYANGQGVVQNDEEAARWYRLAAEQGVADAQFNLGNYYANGRGVTQDHAAAVRWYRMAAEQGHELAQLNMGFAYANGRGVTEDWTEAARWSRMAADQGNAQAQFNLGLMYRNGQGVARDYAEAARWYRLAAEQGNADAQQILEVMRYRGEID